MAASPLIDNYLPTLGSDATGGVVNYFERGLDLGLRRPYLDSRGRPCVTINTGRWTVEKGERKTLREKVLVRDLLNNEYMDGAARMAVLNSTALPKESWIELDLAIVKAARLRPQAWADLMGANSYTMDGWSKMVLEHETMSDPGEAVIDMDGLTPARSDSPKFQLEGLPLPITHSDFWFSKRRLDISRAAGRNQPLDTSMGEAAATRVMESVEKVTIGVDTGITGVTNTFTGGYGRTPKVYGYLNFTNRLTKTNLYKPTGVGRAGTGWLALDTLRDVLAMRDTLYLAKMYGPFMLYHSNDWDQYMDADYTLTGGNVTTQTLRNRLRMISGIVDVRRLDFLSASATQFASDPAAITSANPWTLLMVQQQGPASPRAINGMSVTPVQWESKGGMQLMFKVMCILVAQLRADYQGNCGLLHANASAGV